MANSFEAEVNHPPIQVENTMQQMNKALQTNDKKKTSTPMLPFMDKLAPKKNKGKSMPFGKDVSVLYLILDFFFCNYELTGNIFQESSNSEVDDSDEKDTNSVSVSHK